MFGFGNIGSDKKKPDAGFMMTGDIRYG